MKSNTAAKSTWTFAPNHDGEERGFHDAGVETFKGNFERYLAREASSTSGASGQQLGRHIRQLCWNIIAGLIASALPRTQHQAEDLALLIWGQIGDSTGPVRPTCLECECMDESSVSRRDSRGCNATPALVRRA